MNKKITVNLAVAIAILAMTVTFVVTMILSTQIFNSTVSSVRQKQVMYNNIAEIDKAVRANYYGEINDTTLYDMMGAGYMAGIGDANAVYYIGRTVHGVTRAIIPARWWGCGRGCGERHHHGERARGARLYRQPRPAGRV